MFDGTLNKVANLFGKKAIKEVLVTKENITLKERVINFVSKPIDNCYPLINIADSLDILPVVDKEGNLTITKYGKSFTPNFIIKDDIYYVDLDEFLNTLELEYTKSNDCYKIITK